MSRNSKNAKRMIQARERSKARMGGTKGAASTTPLHGKRSTYRKNPDAMKKLGEFVAGIKTRIEERWKKASLQASNI
jgi:hypothetical protein